MRARDLMTQPVVTVRRETSLAEVAKIMVFFPFYSAFEKR